MQPAVGAAVGCFHQAVTAISDCGAWGAGCAGCTGVCVLLLPQQVYAAGAEGVASCNFCQDVQLGILC